MLLQAPVGTGKTLALAERAARAIREGIPPARILCVTFTTRAAQELRERVSRTCGREAREMTVQTFHRLCAWILGAPAMGCSPTRSAMPRLQRPAARDSMSPQAQPSQGG